MKFSLFGRYSTCVMIEGSTTEFTENMETLVRILTSVDRETEDFFRNRLTRVVTYNAGVGVPIYMESKESAEAALSLLNACFQ